MKPKHHREEDIDIGVKVFNVTDEEELSRIEEQDAVDNEWTKIDRSKNPFRSGVDVMLFRPIKNVHLRFRHLPLSVIVTGKMEQFERYEPTYCNECGELIEPWEYAIWTGEGHFCLTCGRKLYSEPVQEGELLMCTRCGCDIDEDDDIWGFPESDALIDQCLCSRCAYITHREKVWEHFFKET